MSTNEKAIRQEKWRTLVEEQEKSGLSQTEFCKHHKLILSQFVYYRGRMKANERPNSPNSMPFVPVKINQPSPPSSPEVRVILPNGFQCYFPCHLDKTHIRQFLETLLTC